MPESRIQYPDSAPQCSEAHVVDVNDRNHTCPDFCSLHGAKWKTRGGQEIPVRDMTDTHLTNAVRMMRRNLPTYHERRLANIMLGPQPSGDMATMAFDHGIEHMMEEGPGIEDYPRSYWTLVEEAVRRKLPVVRDIEEDF